MTRAFGLERVRAACETLLAATDAAHAHDWPDWISHRMMTLSAEVAAFAKAIEIYEEETISTGQQRRDPR